LSEGTGRYVWAIGQHRPPVPATSSHVNRGDVARATRYQKGRVAPLLKDAWFVTAPHPPFSIPTFNLIAGRQPREFCRPYEPRALSETWSHPPSHSRSHRHRRLALPHIASDSPEPIQALLSAQVRATLIIQTAAKPSATGLRGPTPRMALPLKEPTSGSPRADLPLSTFQDGPTGADAVGPLRAIRPPTNGSDKGVTTLSIQGAQGS
jgi:hypothetical protein